MNEETYREIVGHFIEDISSTLQRAMFYPREELTPLEQKLADWIKEYIEQFIAEHSTES